jgi:hypothetical protein
MFVLGQDDERLAAVGKPGLTLSSTCAEEF